MTDRPQAGWRRDYPRPAAADTIDRPGSVEDEAAMEIEGESRTLLLAWQAGDTAAGDRLFALAHDELRIVAAALLRRESSSSLSSGDLVNEAVLRLIPLERIDWRDKAHFLALSARVMPSPS